MKRYFKNLWLALMGVNPFQQELDEKCSQYERTADNLSALQQQYYTALDNWDKAEKNDLKLQTHCANLISAMLVYNREITAAKRKLIDDVIDRAKICGSLSNSEYWNLVVKQIYEPSDLNKSINFIAHNLPLDERMKISHLLFKLSIEDDGIMNDEWKLLRTVVNGMNFSKTYIDHLFKFYGPLRSYSDTAIYNKVYGFVKQRKQSGNTGKADGASASASASARAKGGTSSSYNRSSEQARSRAGSAGASAGGASQKAAPKVAGGMRETDGENQRGVRIYHEFVIVWFVIKN